jgi:hypothetical protein
VAQLREIGFSETFIALVVHAANMGAWLLRFDCDEDIDPMLPIGGNGFAEGGGHQLDLFTPEDQIDLVVCA